MFLSPPQKKPHQCVPFQPATTLPCSLKVEIFESEEASPSAYPLSLPLTHALSFSLSNPPPLFLSFCFNSPRWKVTDIGAKKPRAPPAPPCQKNPKANQKPDQKRLKSPKQSTDIRSPALLGGLAQTPRSSCVSGVLGSGSLR